MKVLAVDCATSILSVAVSWEGGLVECSLDAGLKHAEALMPLVERCLADARMEARELELIACVEGPGSFTGLRIGMASCKGIAFGVGAPMVLVPSLDCMAWGKGFFPGPVIPVIDARRSSWYSACYEGGVRVSPYLDVGIEGIKELAGGRRALLCGPDALYLKQALGEGWMLDPDYRAGRARALAALGIERFAREGPCAEDAEPLYIRPSDAEEKSGGGSHAEG
jgi:tRNA threonylcarbamoyladenosine biosynthesis protein TsaB